MLELSDLDLRPVKDLFYMVGVMSQQALPTSGSITRRSATQSFKLPGHILYL